MIKVQKKSLSTKEERKHWWMKTRKFNTSNKKKKKKKNRSKKTIVCVSVCMFASTELKIKRISEPSRVNLKETKPNDNTK